MRGLQINLTSLFLIITVGGALAVTFFMSNATSYSQTGWHAIIERAMIYYLVFVIIRTVILVVLSFGDYYFRKSLKEPKNYPVITILIPCFNEGAVIGQAIESVMDLDYPNYEILVLDDGSTDETLVEAKKYEVRRNVRVISQENTGKAGALNRGISEAVGDYVLCMDADSVMKKDVLKLSMAYIERNPKIGAIAGSVVVENTAGKDILVDFQRLEYVIGLNFHKTAQSFLSTVTIVPGPIGLFKKSVMLEVGGYLNDTFAEDCDLSIRILVQGYDIVYCPEMIGVTEVPDDMNSLIGQRYRWARGVTQAILKHSHWLFHPIKNFRNFFLMLYLILESILIPLINFCFIVITLEQALLFNNTEMLGPFYISLTLLDIFLTLYSVITEKQNFVLLSLSVFNRLTYGLFLEVIRFFSLIDEVLGNPMKWGTLIRKGL